MGFHLYKFENKNGSADFVYKKALKLSGADGLVAKQVAGMPVKDESVLWNITGKQLVGDMDEGVVIFDSCPSDSDKVVLYQLMRISGESFPEKTEILLHFKILVNKQTQGKAKEIKQSFSISAEDKTPELHEAIVLTGGYEGGEWKWAAPDMNIGAAVVSSAG